MCQSVARFGYALAGTVCPCFVAPVRGVQVCRSAGFSPTLTTIHAVNMRDAATGVPLEQEGVCRSCSCWLFY